MSSRTDTVTELRRSVWLSYTWLDLSIHADAVDSAVEHDGWLCRRLKRRKGFGVLVGGFGSSALDDNIKPCDALIVLVAHRYGTVPSPKEGFHEGLSWVQLEVTAAERLRVPVLPFVLDDTVTWPAKLIDRGEEAEKLRRFKSYLEGRYHLVRFTTAQDLAEKAVEALKNLGYPNPFTQTSPPRFDGSVDPLLIAWRLVVEKQSDYALLLHLDAARLQQMIERVSAEYELDSASPAALLKRLEERQAGAHPNPLWLAWMRQVQAATLESLTKASPTEAGVDAPAIPISASPPPERTPRSPDRRPTKSAAVRRPVKKK
jgi:hypothetical protein